MINRINANPAMFLPNIANRKNNAQHNTNPTDTTIANPASNQSKPVQLDSKALVSAGMMLPGGGWMNASVYKSENHSDDNPVFLVSIGKRRNVGFIRQR